LVAAESTKALVLPEKAGCRNITVPFTVGAAKFSKVVMVIGAQADSGSLAVAVNVSVVNSSTVLSAIAFRTGG